MGVGGCGEHGRSAVEISESRDYKLTGKRGLQGNWSDHHWSGPGGRGWWPGPGHSEHGEEKGPDSRNRSE